jgi:hypothetical protein
MKNSILKILSFSALFLTLQSCNDNVFFEKEFLEPISGDGTGGVVLIDQEETYTQSTQTRPLEILWVIDDSGSMNDEQISLATNFQIFINNFVQNNTDFKMAITTTDTSGTKGGNFITDSNILLNSTQAELDPNAFINNFQNMIMVGTSGSGYEKGLKASKQSAIKHPGFFSPDSYLAIVYVSDENDQSEGNATDYINYLQVLKHNHGLTKAYSIVNTNGSGPTGNGYTQGYDRYEAVSNLTNGSVSNINGNFSNTLLNISNEIFYLLDKFPLANTPYDKDSIKIFVEGVEQIGNWDYVSSSKVITFHSGHTPTVGSTVKVKYQTKQ